MIHRGYRGKRLPGILTDHTTEEFLNVGRYHAFPVVGGNGVQRVCHINWIAVAVVLHKVTAGKTVSVGTVYRHNGIFHTLTAHIFGLLCMVLDQIGSYRTALLFGYCGGYRLTHIPDSVSAAGLPDAHKVCRGKHLTACGADYSYSIPEEPSAENKEELRRDLQVKTWNDDDEKQLIFIRPSTGRSLSPNLNHALIMFNRLFGLQAAEYRNGILLFLNRKILDERFGYEPVIQRILQLSYCAGISNSFQDLSDLPLMAQRALAALKSGDQSAGSINYFHDYYMNYFFSLIHDSDKEILRHPLLDQLKRYDKRYGSSLYETLFHYLENERGIAKTAAAMKLHRSTLLHRIERIEELAQGLLEHPETRMHILLSFYLEKEETGE
jgi:hypothetical protein